MNYSSCIHEAAIDGCLLLPRGPAHLKRRSQQATISSRWVSAFLASTSAASQCFLKSLPNSRALKAGAAMGANSASSS